MAKKKNSSIRGIIMKLNITSTATIQRCIVSALLLTLVLSFGNAQNINIDWYSESENNGILIQNSYPKGGPYPGPIQYKFGNSYLVFFTSVTNTTDKAIELNMNFSADPIPIPNSPNTFVKLFLPQEEMTVDKVGSFSYGITELDSFEEPTDLSRTVRAGETTLFYIVAFFYQIKENDFTNERGGNRAELVLKGNQLYYNLKQHKKHEIFY